MASNALSYDGANDYSSCPDTASLDVAIMTIEVWVKWSGTADDYDCVFNKGNDAADANYQLRLDNTAAPNRKWQCLVGKGGGVYDVVTSTVNANTNWTHLAFTYEGVANGLLEFFVDGVSQGTTSNANSLITNNYNFYVGCMGTALGYYFNGIVDEIRISDVIRYTEDFT